MCYYNNDTDGGFEEYPINLTGGSGEVEIDSDNDTISAKFVKNTTTNKINLTVLESDLEEYKNIHPAETYVTCYYIVEVGRDGSGNPINLYFGYTFGLPTEFRVRTTISNLEINCEIDWNDYSISQLIEQQTGYTDDITLVDESGVKKIKITLDATLITQYFNAGHTKLEIKYSVTSSNQNIPETLILTVTNIA